LAKQQPERHLAAILAADVAGYSRLMSTDEEGTLTQLKEHRRQLGDPKIKEHRGHIIKTTGDGMLVEFASAVDAVRCAVEIQRGMAERNADAPPEHRIEFRIGINVGTSSRTTVACALEVLFRLCCFGFWRAELFPFRINVSSRSRSSPLSLTTYSLPKSPLAAMIASLAGRWRRTRNQIG
jgi:hypothetical protein